MLLQRSFSRISQFNHRGQMIISLCEAQVNLLFAHNGRSNSRSSSDGDDTPEICYRDVPRARTLRAGVSSSPGQPTFEFSSADEIGQFR